MTDIPISHSAHFWVASCQKIGRLVHKQHVRTDLVWYEQKFRTLITVQIEGKAGYEDSFQ